MIPTPPPIVILREMKRLGLLADFTQAGVTSAPVTVRHARNRDPAKGEIPSVTLILVSDDPRQDEQDHNMDERTREMVVDVQIDLVLANEESGDDDTGLLALMLVLAVFVQALRTGDPAGPNPIVWVSGLVQDLFVDSLAPDDRSTPDDGRMTRALRVLYRVRSDDENVLLAAGVDG